jgi:nicotinate phosphoribosyltransferase
MAIIVLPTEIVCQTVEDCGRKGIKHAIVVSGGFNVERIRKFEKQGVPVDIYAVGSAFYENHGLTKMDFTADVVRVKINGEWVDMAKIGRKACDNPEMEKVW